MKLENVAVKIEKHIEGKKVSLTEVLLVCGNPYINFAFRVDGDIDIESGVYTLEFVKPKAAKEK